MERSECEKLILEHLRAIRAIYKQYRGDAKHLSMSICGGALNIFNCHWPDGADAELPIDVYEEYSDE